MNGRGDVQAATGFATKPSGGPVVPVDATWRVSARTDVLRRTVGVVFLTDMRGGNPRPLVF